MPVKERILPVDDVHVEVGVVPHIEHLHAAVGAGLPFPEGLASTQAVGTDAELVHIEVMVPAEPYHLVDDPFLQIAEGLVELGVAVLLPGEDVPPILAEPT